MGVSINRTPGMGADRIKKRIPRNAPALWNLGATEIRQMFHDGRVTHSPDYDNDFATPAQEWLPEGLSGLLAVQALFPMTAQFEMAGDPAENEVAGAAYSRIDEVWPIIAKRVRVIPAYSDLFIEAYDDVDDPLDITITHLANALADFQNFEFQSYDSRFDSYLNGDLDALNDAEKDGMALFYGKAGCSGCHSGSLLTDHDFHALMLPHFGPGRTRVWDTIVRDVGRMSFTDRLEDAYRFRTPSLRNVALTGPYGHNGAYASLEDMVRHHLNPRESFEAWTPDNLILPEVPWLAHVDFLSFEDRLERAPERAAGHRTPDPERRGDRSAAELPRRADRRSLDPRAAGAALGCSQRPAHRLNRVTAGRACPWHKPVSQPGLTTPDIRISSAHEPRVCPSLRAPSGQISLFASRWRDPG